MFHPDNLTFGQGIKLSRLIAAAQGVAGVLGATVTRFRVLGDPSPKPTAADPNPRDPAIVAGILQVGPLEIPRLDNDPSFPEHGRFTLTLGGGR